MSLPPSEAEIQSVSRELATLLAARVDSLRAAQGWSQRTLADRSGVSTSIQTAIKNGELPGMKTILRLALAFEVGSLEELFGPLPPTSAALQAARLLTAR